MRIFRISIAVFLAAISLCPAADDVTGLYNLAVKNFSAGKYSDAIRCWQRILEIDPEQVPPHKMIEFTRNKITQELTPRVEAFEKNMQSGKWFIAHDAAGKALDIDPTYPGMADKKDKLQEISAIIEDCSGSGAVQELLRKSVHAYFDENTGLMFDAAIYAGQLNKDGSLGRKISSRLAYMEEKYPEARSRVKLIEGMDLMKQLLQSSLDSIYKADYTGAITFCDRILALDEKNTLALMRKGSAYYALNNLPEARKNWQLALKTDPGNRDVKKFLNLLDRKTKRGG